MPMRQKSRKQWKCFLLVRARPRANCGADSGILRATDPRTSVRQRGHEAQGRAHEACQLSGDVAPHGESGWWVMRRRSAGIIFFCRKRACLQYCERLGCDLFFPFRDVDLPLLVIKAGHEPVFVKPVGQVSTTCRKLITM